MSCEGSGATDRKFKDSCPPNGRRNVLTAEIAVQQTLYVTDYRVFGIISLSGEKRYREVDESDFFSRGDELLVANS